jgi:hypothetical protein
MAKARAKLDPTHVQLQLKVTLLDIKPTIWRRLLVPATIKLPKLHNVLQLAFGWTNSHLHAFRLEEDSYEANPPKDTLASLFGSDDQRHDEKKFRLCDLLHAPEDWLIYEYDFGDGWQHDVFVEKLLPGTATKTVTCLAGARAGPPDDCGGPPGYYDLLKAIADPKNPEHHHLVDWLGEPYDPKAFSVDSLNAMLQGLKT